MAGNRRASSANSDPRTPRAGSNNSRSSQQNQADDVAGIDQEMIETSRLSGSSSDPISQMRSTLAIGELIASSRPTAGSRLVASEIRSLTDAIRDESAALRREIDNLGTNLTNSLKSILEDENERNSSSMRGFMPRRFPVFRRPRRIPFTFAARATARKSLGTGFTALSDMSSSATSSTSNASTSTGIINPNQAGSSSSTGTQTPSTANTTTTTTTTSTSTPSTTTTSMSTAPRTSNEMEENQAIAELVALARASALTPSTPTLGGPATSTSSSATSSGRPSSITAVRGSQPNTSPSSTTSSPDLPVTPPQTGRNAR